MVIYLSENVGNLDLCITPCSLNTSKYIVLFSYLIYVFFLWKNHYLSENVGTLELCNILPSLNALFKSIILLLKIDVLYIFLYNKKWF